MSGELRDNQHDPAPAEDVATCPRCPFTGTGDDWLTHDCRLVRRDHEIRTLRAAYDHLMEQSIERWHFSEAGEHHPIPVYDWLGIDVEQYARWVEDSAHVITPVDQEPTR